MGARAQIECVTRGLDDGASDVTQIERKFVG
jgi:hypothetical protein